MTRSIEDELENALTVLSTPAHKSELPQRLQLATATLRACRAALVERSKDLELLTEPELDALREVQTLRAELDKARSTIQELNIEVRTLRAEVEINEKLQADDRAARKELERKVKQFDKTLMTDDQAFDRFMDQNLRDRPPSA